MSSSASSSSVATFARRPSRCATVQKADRGGRRDTARTRQQRHRATRFRSGPGSGQRADAGPPGAARSRPGDAGTASRAHAAEMPASSRLNRRDFLRAGAAGGAALAVFPRRAPALIRSRPTLTHGVQSGDVTSRSAVVWARADRPSRMRRRGRPRPAFRDVRADRRARAHARHRLHRQGRGSRAAARARDPLPRARSRTSTTRGCARRPATGRSVRRRGGAVTCRSSGAATWPGRAGASTPTSAATASSRRWGALDPDFFLCSGDTVYADGPLTETVTLPGRADVAQHRHRRRRRRSPRRSTSSAASSPTTCSTRTCARSPPQVPQINQWDDHEVRNNWYPGPDPRRRALHRAQRRRARRARPAGVLRVAADRAAAGDEDGRIYRGSRTGRCSTCSCSTCAPTRTRTATTATPTRSAGCSAREQREWLKRELAASTRDLEGDRHRPPARPRRPRRRRRFEGVAQGDPGAPLGRELEFADVLRVRAPHRRRPASCSLTADVHYTAAHHYDPARAAVADFDAVLGVRLRPAQRGRVRAQRARRHLRPRGGVRQGAARRQHLARRRLPVLRARRDRRRQRVMTVTLRDLDGAVLFTQALEPPRRRH